MKKLIIALALGSLSVLGGCQTIARLSGNEAVSVADEKTLLVAEGAFQQSLILIQAGVRANYISPAQAQVLIPKVKAAKDALDKARQAYDANERAEGAIASNRAFIAVAEVVVLLEQWGLIK